jgi:hypothetical protein
MVYIPSQRIAHHKKVGSMIDGIDLNCKLQLESKYKGFRCFCNSITCMFGITAGFPKSRWATMILQKANCMFGSTFETGKVDSWSV